MFQHLPLALLSKIKGPIKLGPFYYVLIKKKVLISNKVKHIIKLNKGGIVMKKTMFIFYNQDKQVDYIGAKLLQFGLVNVLHFDVEEINVYPIKFISEISKYISYTSDIYLIDIPLTINNDKENINTFNSRIFSINPWWADEQTKFKTINNLTIKTFGYKFSKYNETIRPSIIAMIGQILKTNILVRNNVNKNCLNLIDNLDTLEYGINPVTPATNFVYNFINTKQPVNVHFNKASELVVSGNIIERHRYPSYYLFTYEGAKILVAREEESYQKSRLLLANNEVDAIITLNLKAKGNSVLKYLLINNNSVIATRNLIQGLHFDLAQPMSKTGYATSNLNLQTLLYSLLQTKE